MQQGGEVKVLHLDVAAALAERLTGQDPVGGGCGNTAAGGQSHRSDAVLAPQTHDVVLGGGRGWSSLSTR